MDFRGFDDHHRFQQAWDAVRIARPVSYSLFTFGESDLPYYLVCAPSESGKTVSVRQGEVKITRPLLITPGNARPEFQNFFEDAEGEEVAAFLLSRTASFSHLHFQNTSAPARYVSDSVEEVVARLNRQLDDQEEDRVAVLTAPSRLAGVALLRYAAERVWQSAPDNIQELRERGFLP